MASVDHDEKMFGDSKHASTEDPSLETDPRVGDWTPAEEAALVRKLDLRIIPMMAIVFALSLIDRANVSSAYISGMGKDLAMNIGTVSQQAIACGL